MDVTDSGGSRQSSDCQTVSQLAVQIHSGAKCLAALSGCLLVSVHVCLSVLQLAMVLLLRELLPGLQQPPQLYDPAFSQLDTLLLQQMGLGVIAVNEEGRRSIGGQQTLFFLPHCEVRQAWRQVCLGFYQNPGPYAPEHVTCSCRVRVCAWWRQRYAVESRLGRPLAIAHVLLRR